MCGMNMYYLSILGGLYMGLERSKISSLQQHLRWLLRKAIWSFRICRELATSCQTPQRKQNRYANQKVWPMYSTDL